MKKHFGILLSGLLIAVSSAFAGSPSYIFANSSNSSHDIVMVFFNTPDHKCQGADRTVIPIGKQHLYTLPGGNCLSASTLEVKQIEVDTDLGPYLITFSQACTSTEGFQFTVSKPVSTNLVATATCTPISQNKTKAKK